MKVGKGVLTLILFLLLPSIVNAECTNKEIVKYQEAATNIKTSYEFHDYGNNYHKFTIKITNVIPGLVVEDRTKGGTYSTSEISIDYFEPGTSNKFDVIAPSCNKKVYSLYVNVPEYNPYYDTQECKDYPDFKYCQRFIKRPLSTEFEKELEKYKESLNKKQTINSTEDERGLFEMAFDIYAKYYYIVLPIIIVVSIALIIKIKKDSELF